MRRASRVCFVSSYRGKVEVICMLHFSVTFRLLFLVFKVFLLAFKQYYVPPTFISKIIISAASKGSVTPILRPASRTEYRKNARPSGRTKKKREKKSISQLPIGSTLAFRQDESLDVLSLTCKRAMGILHSSLPIEPSLKEFWLTGKIPMCCKYPRRVFLLFERA